jgi:hypothetical protein
VFILVYRVEEFGKKLRFRPVYLDFCYITVLTSLEPLSEQIESNITAPLTRPLELYGRKDILTRLEEIFTSHGRAALTGLGGIG